MWHRLSDDSMPTDEVLGMQKFIARQPILDNRESVYGYELLFRAADEPFYRGDDQELASASVISDSLFLYGLDELTNGARAFINCTRDTLVKGLAALLPRERVVLEVLETIEPDDEVVAAWRSLKQDGYMLALDDFQGAKQAVLTELADILKVDVLATPEREQREMFQDYRPKGVVFLAEKVEKRAQFHAAVNRGYTYFQGYFFCKPEIVSAHDIAPAKLACFRLLQAVAQREMDLQEVEEIIKHDVAFSYKLLRYLNSAKFAFVARVISIRHAVMLLGQEELRKWIALVSVATLGEGKPPILVDTVLMRAAFCELLAAPLGVEKRRFEYFFLGLLSGIDAILGRSLRDILAEVPIAEDVRGALLGEPNPLRDVLQAVLDYEQGDWAGFSALAKKLAVREEAFVAMYLKALRWRRELSMEEENQPVETLAR